MTVIDRYEVHVSTDVAHIVSGGGDLHVHESARGYEFGDLDPHRAPGDDLRSQPSLLLAAAQQIVPFQGRTRELTRLAEWRDDPHDFGVVLIHGTGGQGKTRLALRFAALSAAEGWRTVEARPDPLLVSGQRLTDDLPTGPAGRLILIDYAERWPVRLLRALLTDARLRSGRNRVVLLSRPAGHWWEGVRAHIRRAHRIRARRLPLTPFTAESGDRARVFAAARDAFADRLDAGSVRDLEPPGTWPENATALDIQMAALARVYARTRKDSRERDLDDPAALSTYLLEREREYWADLHVEAGMRTPPSSMARLVFLASLAGGVTHDLAVDLLTATGLAARGQESIQLLDDHATTYPAAAGGDVLAPLYPDRLAEDFIALLLCGGAEFDQDPWARDKLTALLPLLSAAAPHRAVAMLLSTIAIAQRWEAVARIHLAPLLRDHPTAFLAGGGALLTGLTEVDALDPATLADFEQAMPVTGSADLMTPLAVLTERLHAWLSRAGAAATEAEPLRLRLARRLFHAGRHRSALPHLLGLKSADRSLPDEALVLGYLARTYAALGQPAQARTPAAEAVRRYRRLGRSLVATPEVAALLDLNARLIFDVRQTGAAVSQQLTAVDVWRRLSEVDTTHLAGYATAVGALRRYQAAAGQTRAAAESAQLAVDLWRRADAAQPGTHRVDLLAAVTVTARSTTMALTDRLTAAGEAAKGFEELWRGDITLLPRAAAAVQLWADVLNEAGRPGEALAPARTAHGLFDLLARDDPGVREQRAGAAMTYARSAVDARDDLDEALAAVRWASEFYRGVQKTVLRDAADRAAAGLLRALGRDREADEVLARFGPSRPIFQGAFEREARVSRRMDTSRRTTCAVCVGSGLVPRVVDGRTSGMWACIYCRGTGHR